MDHVTDKGLVKYIDIEKTSSKNPTDCCKKLGCEIF